MGAWGLGHFDNDDAMDWSADLFDIGEEMIDEAFQRVRDEKGEYLEADLCSFALAAAEVVAAMRGKPGTSLPEDIADWVKGKPAPSNDRVSAAREAVEAVLKESELRDLWDEAEQLDEWQPLVDDLVRRLK